MRGVTKLLFLPFAAISLLLLGCGVPITPEAMTATAVADQANAREQTFASTFSGSTSFDTAQSLRPGSSAVAEGSPVQAAQPLSTLTSPTDTPVATATPTETPEPAATETPEAEPSATPEATLAPEASETPTEEPSPTQTPTPAATATPAPVVRDVNQSFVQEFLTLLNAQRTGRGLQPLAFNPVLAAGAQQYAQYMGTSDFFGHDAPDGSTPASRAAATGYAGAWNGEALSAGQPNPQVALNALLASAPHAKILLDPRSVEVGIGYAYVENSHYRSYWVVLTGIP